MNGASQPRIGVLLLFSLAHGSLHNNLIGENILRFLFDFIYSPQPCESTSLIVTIPQFAPSQPCGHGIFFLQNQTFHSLYFDFISLTRMHFVYHCTTQDTSSALSDCVTADHTAYSTCAQNSHVHQTLHTSK